MGSFVIRQLRAVVNHSLIKRWVVFGIAIATFLIPTLCNPGHAWASLTDDRYDGNIFALYAGNGAIVPPRVNLAQSLKQEKPTLLFFYVDDSSDCKEYSFVISQLQAPYGRVANFVPVMADAVPLKDSFSPNESGYYFKGSVPQTLVLDGSGKVRFDQTGAVTYEEVDDVFREVFDLMPREESKELRRRVVNELNVELVPGD
ncbi:thioredoxin family protein [Leptolyngbyaceae cyanobacterium CCMR0082]|uniref:Thioredoxin family protein n=2 Tax=Adonisia turfae TaxID=2950184 RepID=A0A6M0S989_9CYAN|nr:thylakoid membrane photosystem I accumulation factor [Adonisia turfae]MDV3352361.1 thylakoid membrane photosystem I accumulation factor [Leptothoe sp. LEGE 181152]NEZ58950.1 thioredoxin family protein [Adonisia turfae CCMR0081]NEZ65047.1 thioredoxin family protein [Adonisia turfae CCMR0082]